MEPRPEADAVPVEVAPPPPPKPGSSRGGLFLVLGLAALAAAISALVLTNFKDSTVYAKGVDQLMAEQDRWVGRAVRVEGILVRGTLKFQEKPCEYRFDATKGGATVHVRYASCIKPDTLRDDMPEVGVTAEGKLLANGEFQATNVLAKCPSKYEMKDKPGGPNGAPPMPPGPGPASIVP
jgi:cytochrome c-type biogenesis protein CcmE